MPPALGFGVVGRELRELAVVLFEIGRVVPAQAVIESQFARDLPGVLHEEADLMFAQPDVSTLRDSDRIDQAQQEAGVRKSDVAAAGSGGLQVRKAGFVRR